MDVRKVERLAKFAGQVAHMKFYEFEGHLRLQGLFSCPQCDAPHVKELAEELNEAIRDAVHTVELSLKNRLTGEVAASKADGMVK